MNTKSAALLRLCRDVGIWQCVACACLAIMLLETLYIAHLHFRLLACLML